MTMTIEFHTGVHMATYPAGATFGPRRLRDWEMVWIREGDAEYRRDEVPHSAPEGSLVMCQPGAVDAFVWDRQRRTRHGYFHFTLTGELPEGWGPLATWPVVRVAGGANDLMVTLFRHLLAWDAAGDRVQRGFVAQALLAAYVTGQGGMNGAGDTGLPEPVALALRYIEQRLDEDPAARIPLADLARAACVTPEYLCRVFGRSVRRSPVETVRLARLDHAVRLLAHTNYGVGEVAALCGFECPFHFSRLVHTTYGHSPRGLRRALAAGEPIPESRWRESQWSGSADEP